MGEAFLPLSSLHSRSMPLGGDAIDVMHHSHELESCNYFQSAHMYLHCLALHELALSPIWSKMLCDRGCCTPVCQSDNTGGASYLACTQDGHVWRAW